MTNSPWATLMIPITPQTRAMPYAASAKIAPMRMPSSRSWTASGGAANRSRRFCISAADPWPHDAGSGHHSALLLRHLPRPDQLRLRPLGRRHDFVVALLHLVEHHGLGGVLPGVVELDRAEERHHVRLRNRVPDLLWIERPGASERVGVDEDGGARLGRLVRRGILELLLERVRVIVRAAEPLVLVGEVPVPLRSAQHSLGLLAQGLGDLRGIAARRRDDGHVDL